MTALAHLQQVGIRRLGPKGRFRYVTETRRPAPDADRRRANALRLPPAWTDVFINPSPHARLQAIGRDRAGRWQYRYHPDFVRKQEQHKYDRLLHFAAALPRLREVVRHDLCGRALDRPRVLAGMLRILSTCFLRPGGDVYANEHGHFGLATLRHRHVSVQGDVVCFHFVGKSGQQQHRELHDAELARLVRQLLKLPGGRLFQYRDEAGALHPLTDRLLNARLHEVMGRAFTAKDFRTWAGTLLCATALARASSCEAHLGQKRTITCALRETAEVLGNTPAVCRSAYLSPGVPDPRG